MTRTELPELRLYSNRWKQFGLAFLALVLGILCGFMIGHPPKHHNVIFLSVIVGAGILFFGGGGLLLLYSALRNLYKNQPALTFSAQELKIYVPRKNIYLTVKWIDISGFSVASVYGQKCILIGLHRPDEVIANERNKISKAIMRGSTQLCGTPYSITTSLLVLRPTNY